LHAHIGIANPWIPSLRGTCLLRTVDLDRRPDHAAIRFIVGAPHEPAQAGRQEHHDPQDAEPPMVSHRRPPLIMELQEELENDS
jgi:hypothetical protein